MLRAIACLLAVVSLAAAQQPATSGGSAAQFRISGTVVSAAGERLSATRVRIALTTNLSVTHEYLTGEDGKFQFENLPPAKYALTASRRGFREQAFDQHGYLSTAIAVGPNLVSENLVFRLNPDSEIFGKVTEDGDPVSNGQAVLFQHGAEEDLQRTHFVESTMIDDQGHYHFGHLLPGTYLVAVNANPWYAQHQFTPVPLKNDGTDAFTFRVGGSPAADPKLDVVYPTTFYQGTTDGSSAIPIVLRAGEKYEANIPLRAVRALRLRVHVPVDDPARPPGISIMQSAFGEPQQPVSSIMQWSQQGYYEVIGLPPGHMIVQAQGGQIESRQQEIDLEADSDVDLTSTNTAISVTGMVAFLGAETVPPNAFIVIQNRDSGRGSMAQIAQDGSFATREHLGPGRYEVYTANISTYAIVRMAASGARVVGQTIDIKANSNEPVRLSIVMSRQLGSLEGTAYFNEKPIAGAMIVLVPKGPMHNASQFPRDQSDSDGTFTLPWIIPGKYTLIGLRDAWGRDWSNPSVLNQYLSAGLEIEIAANGKYKAKVNVQPLR